MYKRSVFPSTYLGSPCAVATEYLTYIPTRIQLWKTTATIPSLLQIFNPSTTMACTSTPRSTGESKKIGRPNGWGVRLVVRVPTLSCRATVEWRACGFHSNRIFGPTQLKTHFFAPRNNNISYPTDIFNKFQKYQQFGLILHYSVQFYFVFNL